MRRPFAGDFRWGDTVAGVLVKRTRIHSRVSQVWGSLAAEWFARIGLHSELPGF